MMDSKEGQAVIVGFAITFLMLGAGHLGEKTLLKSLAPFAGFGIGALILHSDGF